MKRCDREGGVEKGREKREYIKHLVENLVLSVLF